MDYQLSDDDDEHQSLLEFQEDIELPGVVDTFNQIRSRKVVKDYEKKLEQEEYLDTKEQEELISDLQRQANLIDAIWKYILFAFGVIMSLLVFLFISVHCIGGSDKLQFHRELEPIIGRGTLLILQILSLVAFIVTFIYSLRIPRPSDELFICTVAITSISSLFFLFMLTIRQAFSITSLWMPVANILYFVAALYAIHESSSFQKEMNSLRNQKYRYESI